MEVQFERKKYVHPIDHLFWGEIGYKNFLLAQVHCKSLLVAFASILPFYVIYNVVVLRRL